MGSSLPPKFITPEEYLRIERAAEFKSEYFAGEMFAMTRGSPHHSRLRVNVISELGNRLKGSACRVYDHDLRVLISETGLFVYPDITVVCGPLETSDETGDTVTNPTLIVEVLSDATEAYDRGTKFTHYRKLASLRELLFVSHDQPIVECFTRRPDGTWNLADARGLEASIELKSIGISLSLANLFDNVEFQSLPPRIRPLPS